MYFPGELSEWTVYCLQASALPMSIIIVGIGSADFEGMSDEHLFALFTSL